MRNQFIIIFLLCSSSLLGCSIEQNAKTVEQSNTENSLENDTSRLTISYIGNMGVLLAHNDKVVLIDGFHKRYKPVYAYPSENTVQKIINGTYKHLDAPDVALVTHHHKDHFDADYLNLFLQKNPGSIVVAPQQVNDQIRKRLHSSTALKQVLYNDATYSIEHREVNITAFKCPHTNAARHASIQNIAYLIFIDNYSILHLGDANWDMAESILKEKKIHEQSIDIAILPYWMLLDSSSIRKVNNAIAPKHLIATHIPPGFSDSAYKHLQKMHANITLFTVLNEQAVYK